MFGMRWPRIIRWEASIAAVRPSHFRWWRRQQVGARLEMRRAWEESAGKVQVAIHVLGPASFQKSRLCSSSTDNISVNYGKIASNRHRKGYKQPECNFGSVPFQLLGGHSC